jgi:hypothetical protein
VVATALALHTDDLTGRRERDHIIEWKATMRTVWNSVVLVCALILTLPVAQMTLSAGAETGASHTVVAASGTAAPAGGNYAIFTHVTVNARSQIAFDASLGGPSTSGVFVGDGRRTATIALGGDPDPAAANFASTTRSSQPMATWCSMPTSLTPSGTTGESPFPSSGTVTRRRAAVRLRQRRA